MSEEPITYKNFPEVGELVIATIINITDYGSYATLDEYENSEGLLHISEISSSWVKNIRDHVREREKLVLKVLRVDPDKGHIDLSLRRVSGKEKREKMLEWKKKRRAEYILDFAAQKLGIDPKTFVQEIMSLLEERFNTAYSGLEELVERKEDVAEKLKISKEWTDAIFDFAQQKIKPSIVRIRGILELKNYSPDGIDIIKKIIINCKTMKKTKKVRVNIYALGSPKYRVEVTAKNYKDAEKALQEISSCAIQGITANGGEGQFKR